MPSITNFLPSLSHTRPLTARARLLCYVSALAAVALIFSAIASPALAVERISVLPGPNGNVNVISEPDSNGTRYLGGSFTAFDPWDTGSGALVGATSGAVDPSFPKVNGSVRASAADGAGGFYIGGSFTTVDGTARNNAAHINADGSLSAWNPDLDGSVNALAVSGSTVYLGGGFTTVGGTARNHAAAVGTDGTLTAWNPETNYDVYALAVSGSTVYLGGDFSTVGGTARNYAAAVGINGTLSNWDPSLNERVYAVAVSGSTVYLGGDFTKVFSNTADETERNFAAAVGTDGTLSDWNPNLDSTVNALAVSGSTVYLGGDFTCIGSTNPNDCEGGGGAIRSRAAAVGTNGTLDPIWKPNLNGAVSALAVSGSTVYLGGNFNTVFGTARNYAAAVGTDGTLSDWNPNLDNYVSALSLIHISEPTRPY